MAIARRKAKKKVTKKKVTKKRVAKRRVVRRATGKSTLRRLRSSKDVRVIDGVEGDIEDGGDQVLYKRFNISRTANAEVAFDMSEGMIRVSLVGKHAGKQDFLADLMSSADEVLTSNLIDIGRFKEMRPGDGFAVPLRSPQGGILGYARIFEVRSPDMSPARPFYVEVEARTEWTVEYYDRSNFKFEIGIGSKR